jgi:hypothetical protein
MNFIISYLSLGPAKRQSEIPLSLKLQDIASSTLIAGTTAWLLTAS